MRIVQKIYILEKSYKIWRIHRNVKKLNNNIMRLTKSKFKRPRCENCGLSSFPRISHLERQVFYSETSQFIAQIVERKSVMRNELN